MKKFSKTIAMFTLSFLALACNKEDVQETVDENVSRANIDYTLDKVPLLENEQDINQLIINSNDKDEEKLNKYLYEIGLATKELIKNKEFNQTIIEMAKKSDNQTAYLLDLKTEAPIFFNIINENLAKNNLSLDRIAEYMTHEPLTGNPEYPITMEVEKYVPAIFVPNLAAIDHNKQPLLSPNIETDCSQNSDIEDYIVTWYYDENSNLHEIIVGEETSLKTTNPLFLVDHASPKGYLPPIQQDNNHKPEDGDQDRGFDDIVEFRTKQIGIKSGYGYETGGSNKSEFALAATYTSSGYPSNHVFHTNNDNSVTYKTFLPGTHNVNLHFSPNYVPTYGLSGFKVFWNTFERDWNRSPKSLGYALNVLGEPGTYDDTYLSGRRRYDGDWYAWVPATLPSHELPIGWYQWLTEINFDNWKSNINVRSQE